MADRKAPGLAPGDRPSVRFTLSPPPPAVPPKSPSSRAASPRGSSPAGKAKGSLLWNSAWQNLEKASATVTATADPSPSPGGEGRNKSLWTAPRQSLLAFRGLGGLSTSFFLEKQAIIIDFGRAYTKVGFATESRPRHIFPTPELNAHERRGPCLTTTVSEQHWVDILDRLISKVFFHYLSVNPKERRVVICDSDHLPSQFRTALAFVLFKRMLVPAVAFVTDLVLPLYLTGLSSGIVIDCGYQSTRVLATFAGVPVLSARSSAPSGGRQIASRFKKSLTAELPPEDAARSASLLDDPGALEDFVVRACYVKWAAPVQGADGEVRQQAFGTEQEMPFATPDGGSMRVPAACRWQAAEVLFCSDAAADPDGSGREDEEALDMDGCRCGCIPEAFTECLQRCPVDVRAAVVQNVVVCGGCAALRGLLPRLATELQAALRGDPKLAELADRLLFTPIDFAPICAVWNGGAIFGALEGANDFTADHYSKGRALPDWARDGFV